MLGQILSSREKAMGAIKVNRERLSVCLTQFIPSKGRVQGNLHGKVCNKAICVVVKKRRL